MLPFFFSLSLLAQVEIAPFGETVSEAHQTDDPAVWEHPRERNRSLILGTIKMAAPEGGVAVYRMDGSRLMTVSNLDRPNNIDVAYGFRVGGRTVDIAVVTERNGGRLRIFAVKPEMGLEELGTVPVFAGETGPRAQPMGVALYRRKRDGALFAIVSRKGGPLDGYLWQYRLTGEAGGGVRAEKVREFGRFSGAGEIEAVAVDGEREEVYYADEGAGIRKYQADPAHAAAGRELAVFGQSGWKGDREGIAVYGGYVVATDQQRGNSEFHVFSRDTLREVGVFRVGADTTDGIEISRFGLFVAMNDSRRNFLLVEWKAIAAGLGLRR
ncbi:MAG: phytase [Acidobacteriota bacterium]|jgi:3-phytase|nr:phytase [Acidobacteriaceae bacterium]